MPSSKVNNFISKVEPLYDFKKNHLSGVVHIVGTNGKGSTLHFLSKILSYHGFLVNSFTSPHLLQINERIKINLQDIDSTYLQELDSFVYSKLERGSLTFFEDIFLKALLAFKDNKADFNLIEAGIGAKYDITNILHKKLSIITKIGHDHQDLLGSTLEAITKDKTETMQKNTPCVVGLQQQELYKQIYNTACVKNTPVFMCGKDFKINKKNHCIEFDNKVFNLPLEFKNSYQMQNVASAIYSAYLLIKNKLDPNITYKALCDNFVHQGRLQELKSVSLLNNLNASFLLDCAHNYDGFKELVFYIKNNFKDYKLSVVVALQKTKDLQSFFKQFKNVTKNIYFIEIDDCFYSQKEILKHFLCNNFNINVCNNYKTLVNNLQLNINPKDKNLILFTGSFYLLNHLAKSGFSYS